MPQHILYVYFADIFIFVCRRIAQGARQTDQFGVLRRGSQFDRRRVVWYVRHVIVFADIHLCVAGELPKELGNLVNLKQLMLSFNDFTGKIVSYIRCAFCLHLTFFAGELPKELRRLVNLITFDARTNKLTGDCMSAQHTCVRTFC